MDEKKFNSYIKQMEMYIKFSDHKEADFFNGYVSGLRRNFHGQAFGSERDHEKFMKNNDKESVGYKFGFRAISPGITIKEYYEMQKPQKTEKKKSFFFR
jgi:hypothetical protein